MMSAKCRGYAYSNFADVLEEGWPISDPQQRSELEVLLWIGLEDAEVREQAEKALFFRHHPPVPARPMHKPIILKFIKPFCC